jgi:zinc transporter 1/2/3
VDTRRLITKAFIMEIAIATHSIIIGVAFGALGDDSLGTIRVLFAALSFHQFFEGIALGSSLVSARRALGGWMVVSFIVIFVLTTPVGIMIGMLAVAPEAAHEEASEAAHGRALGGEAHGSESSSPNQLFAQGVLNALAAGNLIYIALVEMIAEDMSATHLAKRFSLKALMVAALVLGDLCMAILAIWA